jgi:hypothetical protein
MAAATMTRWSEARTFYSFFMCLRLVLYWMILDLYWTCGELDVLWVSIWSCFEDSLFGEAGKTVIIYKKHTIHSLVNQYFYPRSTYIHRLTDEPISHVAPRSQPMWPTFLG